MDEVKTYVNVKFQNTGPQSPSNDGLTSTYSELNFPKDEPLIVENEDPPTASRPGELPITAQTGAHEHESKLKMENRPYRQICPLCLVTSAFIVIVIGLSIHVSQIRHSKITLDRNYHELNSTLQSKISVISHLNHSEKTYLKNLSALTSKLSVFKRMHTNLNHRFTELETKFRSVNETKGQICELLTSRREQACSQDWIRNEDRCYFISKIKSSYDVAKHHCSSSYSKLLEVNSTEKANFVKNALRGQRDSYWIGSCEAGKMGPPVVYKMDAGKFQCSECNAGWLSSCKNYQHRFICEKPTPLCADIPEKIRDLCQKSVGPT
ncbi:uncharacterized protein [Mobula birostris]|uniref:uncharacterized protein isoform X2 n=1 Tax=Mobula birostris TaxID=1983395 RepID=UPI003B28B252